MVKELARGRSEEDPERCCWIDQLSLEGYIRSGAQRHYCGDILTEDPTVLSEEKCTEQVKTQNCRRLRRRGGGSQDHSFDRMFFSDGFGSEVHYFRLIEWLLKQPVREMLEIDFSCFKLSSKSLAPIQRCHTSDHCHPWLLLLPLLPHGVSPNNAPVSAHTLVPRTLPSRWCRTRLLRAPLFADPLYRF